MAKTKLDLYPQNYEAYDICQISFNSGSTWEDYATIRTADDAVHASNRVLWGRGTQTQFRVLSPNKQTVKMQ